MTVAFETLPDGIRIRDGIEHVQFEARTRATDVRDVDPEEFYFPVSAAVAAETTAVEFPKLVSLYAWSGGDLVASCAAGDDLSLGAGVYEIDVSGPPMKLYVRLAGPVEIRCTDSRTRVELPEAGSIYLGARSLHERPASTATVEKSPEGLMAGVSTFGSALKAFSPERSFPTLRGHPPLLEFGPERDVPASLEPPETGVRIEVPAEYGPVFVASTLAYYLGARVVPGPEPRLVAAGESFPLADDERLSAGVARTLKHLFTLDCAVRTEGYYEVDLHERRVVEERVDLDAAALYDAPLDERTAAYLSIPTEPLEDVVEWHLTTDIAPTPANAEILPFVANDLSLVRNPEELELSGGSRAEPQELTDFFRAARPAAAGEFTRSKGDVRGPTENSIRSGQRVITPESADTVGHAWVGEHYPMGASKPTLESFRRRLEHDVSQTSTIDVQMVCNDEEMREEAGELYGFRDILEFDIDIAFDLTKAEMRELLAQEIDFLHFIGHVDDRGMQCSDGYLDLHTLEHTGVTAFLLNACRSYEQGMEMIRAGSSGGLVTVTEVANSIATNVGRTMARLLDYGFDLFGVLDLAREQHIIGGTYSIVGDGGVTLCQSDDGAPGIIVIEKRDAEDEFALKMKSYPTQNFGIGTMCLPLISNEEVHYLAGSELQNSIERGHLYEFLTIGRTPIIVAGELLWTDELSIDSL